MFAFLAMTASAAKSPVQRRVIDERVIKMSEYAFPDEHNSGVVYRDADFDQALGSFSRAESPGTFMGWTNYDYQHNGSMGRMIESKTSTEGTFVHISWMYLPGRAITGADSRKFKYNGYNLGAEQFGSETALQLDDERAGYVNIAVTSTNRAIVGGHNDMDGSGADGGPLFYNPHFYWDFSALASTFEGEHVPREFAAIGTLDADAETIWPKFAWTEPATGGPFLHVLCQESKAAAGESGALNYYRRVGGKPDAEAYWDIDASFTLDTVHVLSHDIAADPDGGKVVMVWTAPLPCVPGGPSSSDKTPCDPPRFNQWDSDVWYTVSATNGDVGTWSDTNITQYAVNELEEDGYRPYADLSCLLDADDDELHIVFAASYWPTDAYTNSNAGYFRGRMFHWSENKNTLRVAHAYDWDQTTCTPPTWHLNVARMSISQCRGFHYILFNQYNDGAAEPAIFDDCAVESNPGFPGGSANGELWVVVSEDGGLTWDAARNVTNSYSPGCDSAMGDGGPCWSDAYPSMSRYGITVGDESDDTAQVFMYPGEDNTTGAGNYLDLQYIYDRSPGAIVYDEGTWQTADIMWARLSCVDAVSNPLLGFLPIEIEWPSWTKHNRPDTTDIRLENLGNAALDFLDTKITPFKLTYITDEWLGHTIPETQIPAGLGNVVDAEVYVNMDGVINTPGTIMMLEGGIEFVTNAPTSPDTFLISMTVADTVYPPTPDTLLSSCISLVVNNNLSIGAGAQEEISMGYADDCDTTAEYYLYQASPVIGYKNEGEAAKMNWSIFGNGYADTVGFVQIGNPLKEVDTYQYHDYEAYDAKAYTLDSSIIIETKTFAVQTTDTACTVIWERLLVYDNPDRNGDNEHTGLVIGEALDWDVPGDSNMNSSGYDHDLLSIWQQGVYYADTSIDYPEDCGINYNNSRYGGITFLGMFEQDDNPDSFKYVAIDDGTEAERPFYNAYTESNGRYVYGNDAGYESDTLHMLMTETEGWKPYTDDDTVVYDLHMVMTFQHDYTLKVGKKLLVWKQLWSVPISDTVETPPKGVAPARVAAVINDGVRWYKDDLCPCDERGNVDGVAPINIGDLTFLVAFMFTGGAAPPCNIMANVDGSGPINIGDLTYLVAFMFTGGAVPPDCSVIP